MPPRRYVLIIQRKGGKPLFFTGSKFSERGRPVLFSNTVSASATGKLLRLNFPHLRNYALHIRAI